MTDEQYAVAVVGLMQEATRCEPGRLALERFSLNVLRSQDSPVGSFQICVDLTNRQAALLAGLFAVNGNDFRIGGLPLRESPDEPNDQPEALTVIVVDYDGVNPAKLITSELAPLAASHANYDNFIKRLVAKYEDRFGE